MDRDDEFSRLLGWITRLNAGIASAEAEGLSTRNLIESAEYELQKLRRELETVPQPPDAETEGPRDAGKAAESNTGEMFNAKLRHPSRAWQRLWAA